MDEQMIRKNNMRIFPIYKMFAWDLLFYYAISFLFLTQVKNFTASEVLLFDSFYAIFRVAFQILCVNVVDLLGKQKSLLLGNIFVSISILMMLIINNFGILILISLIQAIGYNLKEICEPTILSDSIPESSSSSKIYSKIDGKGSGFYYVLDAISSISTGFLYVLNPYIPMIICFIFCIISTIISLAFGEPNTKIENTKKATNTGFISYYKDTFSIFKQIIKSSRLKSLLVFSLFFSGLLSVFSTIKSSLLVDISVPEQYFGIILAVMQIIASLSSIKQNWFHKMFKNRLLTWFSLSFVLAFILTGLIIICNISFEVSLIASLITIMLYGIIKGPYYTLIKKYFNSFSNPEVNTKIFAIKSLVENLGRVLISLFVSFLLGITNTAYTLLIVGTIFFVIFIFLLNHMKLKVGLKPEQYPKEDLVFSNEK